MDLPDTNIISYIKECAQFIDQAKAEVTFAFCFLIVYIKYISVDIAQIHLFLLKFLHFASCNTNVWRSGSIKRGIFHSLSVIS